MESEFLRMLARPLSLFRVLRKNVLSICAGAIVGGVAAGGWAENQTPLWRSTATLLVDPSQPKVISSLDDPFNDTTANREYFQTQVELLRSPVVLGKAAKALEQTQSKALTKALASRISIFDRAHRPADEEGGSKTIGWLEKGVSIEAVRLSQLIRIAFDSSDPNLSAEVANEILRSYREEDVRSRREVREGINASISSRLEILRSAVDSSELKLQALREREGVVDNKALPAGGNAKELQDLSEKLVDARVKRSEAEQAFNDIKKISNGDYASVPAVIRNAGVQRSQAAEGDAAQRLAELVPRLGNGHPKIVAARAELSAAQANTKHLMQAVADGISREYKNALATEKSLEGSYAGAKGKLQEVGRKEIEIGLLEREVAANREIYQSFLSRLKETAATAETQSAGARVVSWATPATRPISPKPLLAFLAGTLAGTAGVVLFLIFRDLFDRSIRASSEIPEILGIDLLKAIPAFDNRANLLATSLASSGAEDYVESVRAAASRLTLMRTMGSRPKMLAITSAVPGEGKSTFAASISLVLAVRRRVLLLDGDLRKPRIDRLLGTLEKVGLGEILEGKAPWRSCITSVSDKLDVISAGSSAAYPSDLFRSAEMHLLLQEALQVYDDIVFDSPPLLAVDDALFLNRPELLYLLVVKSGSTPARECRAALERLKAVNASILGSILTFHDSADAFKYYGDSPVFAEYYRSKRSALR